MMYIPPQYQPLTFEEHKRKFGVPEGVTQLASLMKPPEKPPRLDKAQFLGDLTHTGQKFTAPEKSPVRESHAVIINISPFRDPRDNMLQGLIDIMAEPNYWLNAEYYYQEWGFQSTLNQFLGGLDDGKEQYEALLDEIYIKHRNGESFTTKDLTTTFTVKGVEFSAEEIFSLADTLYKENVLWEKTALTLDFEQTAYLGVGAARMRMYTREHLNEDQRKLVVDGYFEWIDIEKRLPYYDTWNPKQMSAMYTSCSRTSTRAAVQRSTRPLKRPCHGWRSW